MLSSMWTASRSRGCSASSPTWIIRRAGRARSPPRISGGGRSEGALARPSPRSAAPAPRPRPFSVRTARTWSAGARRLDCRPRTRPRCRPRSGQVHRPGPQGTPRRAGSAPPEDPLYAARRAAITAARNGAATASLPSPLTAATRDAVLHDLGRAPRNRRPVRRRDHRPRPGRHSPPPDAASPPARHPRRSPSAPPSPPEPSPRPHPRRQLPPPARGTGRQPGATSRSHPCAANTITVRSSPRRAPPMHRKPETDHLHGIAH